MFIAIPSLYKEIVRDISPSNHRVQAVLLTTNTQVILIVNTYFPTDSRNNNIEDVQDTIETVNAVIRNNQFSKAFIVGDINCNFQKNTPHVNYVKNFLESNNFVKSWENFHVDFTHVHEANGRTYISILDHFFWSESFDEEITEAGVIHHVDNKSDHEPIYCIVKMNDDIEIKSSEKKTHFAKPKPSWTKSTQEQKDNFKLDLSTHLENITIPENASSCLNVKCKQDQHNEETDKFVTNILEAVDKAAEHCIPPANIPSGRKKQCMPGWKTQVKPFRDNAGFWFSIWKSAGRPLNTELHKIMKRTRNLYHFQFKKCKKSEDLIKRNNFLNACLNGSSDIFSEIKKLRNSEKLVANSIDGKQENIQEHFAGVYGKLYNSIEDKEATQVLFKEVDSMVNSKSLADVEKVTPAIVKEAVGKLNSNKTDPVYAFTSDFLKNAPEMLFQYLSITIKSFLIHGNTSSVLLLATLVPIIKDKMGDMCSSKNYRSIAISSLVLKIIDWVIIILFGECLSLDDLQFSYQSGCSTTMCTWLAIETIDHFLRNDGEVYSCMMDMTKAFDMVQHSKLFRKLLEVNLPVIFIRLLMVMYFLQYANVRWNNLISEAFPMTNGVKQGAVLSALLYCVYVNGLFHKLRSQKAGCWIGSTFLGILGYADDNLLLAPSRHALQEMLETCENYAKEHNLQFSTNENPAKSKTKCLAYLKSPRTVPEMLLNGTKLPWVKSGLHLGNTIENRIDGMKQDTRIKRAMYIQRNVEIEQEFYFAHPSTKFHLNSVYNSHFSGSSLWNLFSRETEMLENSWNKSFKIMYNLPIETHRYFIEPISGKPHAKTIMIKNFLRFCELVMSSEKSALKQVFLKVKYNVQSITGNNLRQIMKLQKKENVDELDSREVRGFFKYRPAPDEDKWRFSILEELLEAREGRVEIDGFETNEIEEMLEFICVS